MISCFLPSYVLIPNKGPSVLSGVGRDNKRAYCFNELVFSLICQTGFQFRRCPLLFLCLNYKTVKIPLIKNMISCFISCFLRLYHVFLSCFISCFFLQHYKAGSEQHNYGVRIRVCPVYG